MDNDFLKQKDRHWQLDILEMSGADLAQFEIVDIRDPERTDRSIFQTLLRQDIICLPLSSSDWEHPPLSKSKRYLFICEQGQDSAQLVLQLRASGMSNVYALAGGAASIRRKFIA